MALVVEAFHYVEKPIVMSKRKSNFEDMQESLYIKFGNVSHKSFINDFFASPDKKGIGIDYKYYRPGSAKNVIKIMAPFNQHAADEYFTEEQKSELLQEVDSYAGLIIKIHIGCDWFYGGLYQRNDWLVGYNIEMHSLEGDHFTIVDNGYMERYSVSAIGTNEEAMQALRAIDYALNYSIIQLCRAKGITKKVQYYEPPPRREEKFADVCKILLKQQEKRLAPKIASYAFYDLDDYIEYYTSEDEDDNCIGPVDEGIEVREVDDCLIIGDVNEDMTGDSIT